VPDLWEVLGYDRVAEEVGSTLRESNLVCVIEGPPGVGKSWLAKDIGTLWEEPGGSTVLAEGDSLRAGASLYPFAFAMGGLPSRWKAVGQAASGITRASESLIGTAGLLTATVETLLKARSARRQSRTVFLGDAEQGILAELEHLAKPGPLLFIADNLHWWDADSLELLIRLRDPRLWEAFPFLADLRILATQTPEPYQSISNPSAHEAVLVPSETARFTLERVQREKFTDVLVALGARERPSEDLSDLVYSFSGGHLALASRCAERVANGEEAVFLAASDEEEFLRALLLERMRSLGVLGKQAVTLLQIAAVLGLTFRREEVCCASGGDESETVRLLRYCRGEGVLEVADGLDRFVHDIYRQHFLSLASRDKADIHATLDHCLRVSRPADYEIRCLNAVGAEQPEDAATFGVHAALQGEREGRSWRDLPPEVRTAIAEGGADDVVGLLASAVSHLRDYRFTSCIEALDCLPRRLPKSLAAEADYLRAMCLMSTRSEQDRARGRLILESWDGYMDEEPELGVRLMLLLLYGLFHVADKRQGWALEARISHALSDRAGTDPAAEDALYTLDRCAGGLHPPDVSLVRVKEAVRHFGPRDGHHVLRRPVEYYRCLVNEAAKLMENGEYEEAGEVSSRIEELVGEYDAGVFTRLEFPCTNALQVEYRLGLVDASTAASKQQRIAAEHGFADDPYYVENASAVYLTLAGDFAGATELFDRLDAQLSNSRTEPEASMVYLIRGNRCAIRLLTEGWEQVEADWTELTEVARKINYPERDIILARHELLAAEELVSGLTPQEFDRVLIERYPERFGPLWAFFGHSLQLPALELWREN
jgi:hypothetical protein